MTESGMNDQSIEPESSSVNTTLGLPAHPSRDSSGSCAGAARAGAAIAPNSKPIPMLRAESAKEFLIRFIVGTSIMESGFNPGVGSDLDIALLAIYGV